MGWAHRLSVLALIVPFCRAKTVTYDFNVSWVNANPDGLYERKVVGINGQWPLPVIEVNKGDRLVVNMYNGLGGKSSSIHFHGMYQNGTNEMDGPSMVTQCPIPPGSSMTYNFTVEQNGTYWYHCHTGYCYPDGYRQALIVHDDDAYFAKQYDKEFTISLSDWYHDFLEDLSHEFMSLYNPTGAEPIPNAFLFNDTMNSNIKVEPNTTYLIRILNVGAFVGQYLYIQDHNFTIVEIDGVYTEPTEASMLYLSAAQRYAILLTTKNETDKNYPIITVADSTLLDTIPPDLQLNNTNWLEYNSNANHPEGVIDVDESTDLAPFDDLTLVPHDQMALLPDPDVEIEVTVYMNNLMDGYNYAFFDNITYTAPKVPTLYTVMSSGNLSTDPTIYGDNTNPHVFKQNDVVQVIVNNADSGAHPFHLHGHVFQVIARQPSYGLDFYNLADVDPVPFNANNHTAFLSTPPRRDTVVLPPGGYMVLRFVADNPGVWLFHCHIDWHMDSGLAMLFISAPDKIQETLKIPDQHYDVCRAAGVPFEGNAAGNTQNFLDLDGEPRQVANIPDGFTPKGIAAMFFTILSAFLGVASIFVYGLWDMKKAGVPTSS
ncbi:unnamed protein product [Clonostachys rhizophaga]|uniref:Iron transport multicopper oxidase FET3 n=1 Tax=Clonostachys rhizophaga TaxID=160324 RepID=A0A9N9VHX6_9HYPO|nr:unnamed protein product [Clonostachys rhizophaga]